MQRFNCGSRNWVSVNCLDSSKYVGGNSLIGCCLKGLAIDLTININFIVKTNKDKRKNERNQSLSQVANAILGGDLPKYTLTRVAG